MTTILLRKTARDTFTALDGPASESIARIPPGDVVRADIKRIRNIDHHRKFFALLHLIFQNQTMYADFEDMREDITIAAGHCTQRKRPDGTVVVRAKSIAFDKMDQTAFEQFYDRVIDIVCREIIPRLNKDDLRRELEAFAA